MTTDLFDTPNVLPTYINIPTPNLVEKELLEKAGIDLPSALPSRTPNAHTKKKLPSERVQK
jgi:hypothetical protein